jgi:hypothetical protein
MPIDWVTLVAVVMGTSIVLVPVIGLTARFALKPVVEALARWKEAQSEGNSNRLLEQRVALLEAQLGQVEGTLNRVLDEQEFHRRLGTGAGTPS